MTLYDTSTSDSDLLSRCNRTELYQVCRRQGIKVSPATSKEQMIGLILGEIEETDTINEADLWRDDLMGFLLDHWQVVRGQLKCPARSGDPKSCYQCPDAQVISCLAQNRELLVKIRRSR